MMMFGRLVSAIADDASAGIARQVTISKFQFIKVHSPICA